MTKNCCLFDGISVGRGDLGPSCKYITIVRGRYPVVEFFIVRWYKRVGVNVGYSEGNPCSHLKEDHGEEVTENHK